MPLDLSGLRVGGGTPLLRPRDIYTALPKPNFPFPYLRFEQGEVLEGWFGRRDDRDVVIKQNTGGGKTVAGLLIAQSTLNEKVGPAVYLAPDTYLVDQVKQEAARLGIATVSEPSDLTFRSGNAILVTTFHRLVNGLSVFGVAGGWRNTVSLGIVVVDDAHAALAATESQFKITVNADHPAYDQLLTLFKPAIKQQSLKIWADINDSDPLAAVRIPFWVWTAEQQTVLDILRPYRNSDELKFSWPLVADVLSLCAATVTGKVIEIRPPCPPIAKIPSFVTAKRRVYLTATLADDSVLVTDLDADPSMVARPITPGSAADMGERMILAPLALNPRITNASIRELAEQFARGDRDGDGEPDAHPVNVVVLVPSRVVADEWADYANEIATVKDLPNLVPRLKDGHVGLVVLINKYDGVDLPHDACRLLIIDRIPRPLDAHERRAATALAGSNAFIAREVQRIEQGMGRGVRDVEDHCVVLLMGTDLALTVEDMRHRQLFSPASRAQLDLSRQVAALIQGKGLDVLRQAISSCLDRDPDWVKASKDALATVRYDQEGRVSPGAIAAREAFDLAVAHQYGPASRKSQMAVDAASDDAEKGWLAEQYAGYTDLVDPKKAQVILTYAARHNVHVLHPMNGITVERIKPAANQGTQAAAYLHDAYATGNDLILGTRAVLDRITWDKDRTDEAEAAWQRLGEHLGFTSERPDKQYNAGPDNLWCLTNTQFAVIELKTGSQSAVIAKSDIDQLGGSLRWHQNTYGAEINAVPVMLHPQRQADTHATAPDGMRVMTPSDLDAFKSAVLAFVEALAATPGSWSSDSEVAAHLAQHKLTGSTIVQAFFPAIRRQRPR